MTHVSAGLHILSHPSCLKQSLVPMHFETLVFCKHHTEPQVIEKKLFQIPITLDTQIVSHTTCSIIYEKINSIALAKK